MSWSLKKREISIPKDVIIASEHNGIEKENAREREKERKGT